MGRKFYTAPDRFPVRVKDPNAIPEVTFRGYRLAKGVPEFIYEVDGLLFFEKLVATANGSGLEQHLQFGRHSETLFIQPAGAEGVTVSSQPSMNEDGVIEIPEGLSGKVIVTIQPSTGD